MWYWEEQHYMAKDTNTQQYELGVENIQMQEGVENVRLDENEILQVGAPKSSVVCVAKEINSKQLAAKMEVTEDEN